MYMYRERERDVYLFIPPGGGLLADLAGGQAVLEEGRGSRQDSGLAGCIIIIIIIIISIIIITIIIIIIISSSSGLAGLVKERKRNPSLPTLKDLLFVHLLLLRLFIIRVFVMFASKNVVSAYLLLSLPIRLFALKDVGAPRGGGQHGQ